LPLWVAAPLARVLGPLVGRCSAVEPAQLLVEAFFRLELELLGLLREPMQAVNSEPDLAWQQDG
jgi:hypothetical protein